MHNIVRISSWNINKSFLVRDYVMRINAPRSKYFLGGKQMCLVINSSLEDSNGTRMLPGDTCKLISR